MNKHRGDITTLVFLVIISLLSIFSQFKSHKTSSEIIPPPLPFNGTVPKEIVYGDTSKKQVIFTFDAGDGAQSFGRILEVLKKHGVKGTFFVTGKWALRNSALVKQMIAGGHEVFNHSYDHPHLTELTDEQIKAEFVNMDNAAIELFGTTTKPYFRAPYGDRDGRVLKAAAEAGFRSVYWTVDARDWMETDGMTADEVRNKILSNIQPGTIFLMHVGDTITGSILDDVFTQIEQLGYKPVSLTQGL